ncbi:MAG: helix-turn-helix domain-containing protein [Bacilli bacterium]|nr:helix-turn-helix domain-containing protein [Bacilli bacterium]
MKTYDKNVNPELGGRLRFARKEMHFSLNEVSRLTGIQKSQISEYENSKRSPDIYTLSTFAGLYQVSIDYLWYGNGSKYVIYRPKPKEMEILESLATLYYYKVFNKQNGKIVFESLEDGSLISFLGYYDRIINCTPSQDYPYVEVKMLIQRYMPIVEKFLREGHPKEERSSLYKLVLQE